MAAFVTPPTTRVITVSSQNWQQHTPFSDWMPVIAVKRMQALIEVENAAGAIYLYPAIQVANTNVSGTGGTSTPNPSAWTNFGTAISGGDGIYKEDMELMTTLVTGYIDNFWVRFGVGSRMSSGNDGTWMSAEVTAVFAGSSK